MSDTSSEDTSQNMEQADESLGVDKWDDHYDSPKGDLILVSKERIGFRVDAWTLAKKSQFVQDLLALPSHESLDTAPIQLDESASATRHFLDVALSGGVPMAKLDLQRCGEIYSLCERLQANSVVESISEAIQITLRDAKPSDVDAWAVFKVAARLHDAALAKEAIRKFDTSKVNANLLFFDNESLDIYEGIPTRYALALMRSASQWASWYGKNWSPCHRHYVPNTPDDMADKFSLT